MGEKDEITGKILRILVEQSHSAQIDLILKQVDSEIFDNDVMFYYNLAWWFKRENKIRAAIETLSVYEMVLN